MKKKLFLIVALVVCVLGSAFAQTNITVQVVMPEAVNLSRTEETWLPGQVQDRLKSNFQEYLGMRTVVDSNSEATLKKLQRESEDAGRDENTAIELGKISTARFAVFTKIRKTSKGYTLSVDYTDMTTGIQKATATSKEYKSTDELYGNTGAIDEITLILAEKLNIALNSIQKQALLTGTADFTLEEQLSLAKQNEEQYKKLISQFDEQLRELSTSNSLSAIENTKKIEAEKALLAEKHQTEQKRLEELEARKKQAEADALLEAQRSAEQKKKRDELSAKAAKKAAEVRKLKMEKQGVFGQINVIESKKKALVEIRGAVDSRIQELQEQMEKDKASEAAKIRNKPWASIELENEAPTSAAMKRRESQIAEIDKKLESQFAKDSEAVKKAASKQDSDLLAEIRSDQNAITKLRTVSSLGEELMVRYGSYSGTNNGWNVYLSLYSDGVLLYNTNIVIKYEALTGKKPENLATASNSAVADYESTVDMYNSLLLRGDPILYFEIDYTVSAQSDKHPSSYTFSFKELRTISTISKKVLQKNVLKEDISRTMSPAWDIRPPETIKKEQAKSEKEQAKFAYMQEQPQYYHTLGGGGLGGLGINFTGTITDMGLEFGFKYYADIAIKSWLFLDLGVGLNSIDGEPYLFCGVGLNKRIHIGNWHPALYYLFDVAATSPVGSLVFGEELSPILAHSFGMVLPVFLFDLNACYSLKMEPRISTKHISSFSVGLRATLHPTFW